MASRSQSAVASSRRDHEFAPGAGGSVFTPSFFTRILVILSFLLSLMQYWAYINNAGLVPIFCLYLAGFIILLSRDRVNKISNIFSGGALLILFSLLSEVVSYFTNDFYSIQFGLVLIGLFLVARLIIMQIGFVEVVRCYIYSGVICLVTIIVAGRKQLSDYQGGSSRFTGGSGAHPNLLGFTLASYFPLLVGLSLDLPRGKKRLFIIALAGITVALLFTTGSRGSLGAVIGAAVITTMRFTLFNRVIGKLRLRFMQVLGALFALAGAIYVLFQGNRLAKIVKFIILALQLDSKQRGIHSGLSGRTGIWLVTLHRLNGLEWLFGMGYRQGFVIDSGYVTILFDNGLIGGCVILGSILRVLYWAWTSSSRMESAGWWRYRVVLMNLLLIYLINNITTRYLFSFGNQFSLLMIFMLMCQKQDLIGGREAAPLPVRSPRRPIPSAMRAPELGRQI